MIRNDRLIAVPETPVNPASIRSIDALPLAVLHDIEHFFRSYNQAQGRERLSSGRAGPRTILPVRGRLASQEKARAAHKGHAKSANASWGTLPIMVANSTLHCGSGCALGDLLAEWLVYAVPTIAVAFGWHSLFRDQMFAAWVVDYLFAYSFGIVFQYFTIAPMRGLSVGQGLDNNHNQQEGFPRRRLGSSNARQA